MTKASALPQVDEEPGESTSPERRLCQAIILAAIHDAIGSSAVNEDRNYREIVKSRARAWFRTADSDFQLYCIGAGYDPAWLQTKALAYIARFDAGMAKRHRIMPPRQRRAEVRAEA